MCSKNLMVPIFTVKLNISLGTVYYLKYYDQI